MPLLRFCLSKTILTVILTMVTTRFFTVKANCESTYKHEVALTVDFKDGDISSTRIATSSPRCSENKSAESNELGLESSSSSSKEIRSFRKQKETEEEIVKKAFKAEILRRLKLSAPSETTSSPALENSDFKYIKNLLRPDFLKNEEDIQRYRYIVLFPINVAVPSSMSAYPSSLMTYEITSKVVKRDIISAHLCFFNGNYNETSNNFMMTISQINRDPTALISKSFIALNILVPGGEWFKVSMKSKVMKWDPNVTNQIEITCSKCNKTISPTNISYAMNPFILLIMNPFSYDMIPIKNKENHILKLSDTCKWQVTIDFKSLGWNKWIVLPESFNINYCRGSCMGEFDKRFCNHPNIMGKLKKNRSPWDAPSSICCEPVRASSLEIAYMETPYITVFTSLPYMIVEDCGCSWRLDR